MNKHCVKCGKPVQVVSCGNNYLIIGCSEHREFDELIYDSLVNITEEDVWALAENRGLKIPGDKRGEVIQTVKKFLESYLFDGAYNVWDAIRDAVKTALEG